MMSRKTKGSVAGYASERESFRFYHTLGGVTDEV
jgi:hypothetical protein